MSILSFSNLNSFGEFGLFFLLMIKLGVFLSLNNGIVLKKIIIIIIKGKATDPFE